MLISPEFGWKAPSDCSTCTFKLPTYAAGFQARFGDMPEPLPWPNTDQARGCSPAFLLEVIWNFSGMSCGAACRPSLAVEIGLYRDFR